MRLNRPGMRVITFIILASFFITLIAVASAADFYYVATTGSDDTGDGSADNPWRTIQHAVGDTSVSNGDTIIVRDGTYIENVHVEKSLTIRSDNGSVVTTVQALSTDEPVFAISADYVNISGFAITGATDYLLAGIGLAFHVDHCDISNNMISGNYIGISLYESDYNNITKNIIANNSDGIRLEGSRYNTITCNWIHHNYYGLYLFYADHSSTSNVIEQNNIIENGDPNPDTGGWEWQFYNDQAADVAAYNNWWGTVDEALISASIFDKYDDNSKGIVDFSFNLSGPAPCAPIPESAPILLYGAGLLALAGYVLREKRL